MCFADEPDIKADIERALSAVEHGSATTEDAAVLRWALNMDKPKHQPEPDLSQAKPF